MLTPKQVTTIVNRIETDAFFLALAILKLTHQITMSWGWIILTVVGVSIARDFINWIRGEPND